MLKRRPLPYRNPAVPREGGFRPVRGPPVAPQSIRRLHPVTNRHLSPPDRVPLPQRRKRILGSCGRCHVMSPPRQQVSCAGLDLIRGWRRIGFVTGEDHLDQLRTSLGLLRGPLRLLRRCQSRPRRFGRRHPCGTVSHLLQGADQVVKTCPRRNRPDEDPIQPDCIAAGAHAELSHANHFRGNASKFGGEALGRGLKGIDSDANEILPTHLDCMGTQVTSVQLRNTRCRLCFVAVIGLSHSIRSGRRCRNGAIPDRDRGRTGFRSVRGAASQARLVRAPILMNHPSDRPPKIRALRPTTCRARERGCRQASSLRAQAAQPAPSALWHPEHHLRAVQ